MKYYICEIRSKSGIAHYAEDFYRCVMEKKGYILISPTIVTPHFLDGCGGETKFFIELGARQYAEKKALLLIQKKGFLNVGVTLHDPPFLTFPFFAFKCRLLNKISRGFDWYFNTFGVARSVLRKCEVIYVLSRCGEKLLLSRHGGLNVKYMPHLIPPDKIYPEPLTGAEKNIMFFGFIGKGKGLDYALELHFEIMKHYPDVKLHVVGEAVDYSGTEYLNDLRRRYKDNVYYHGYVSEDRLDELFVNVAHVFLPFYEYKYVSPVSGSVINSLRRGRIVWTNPVNSVAELVRDGENGVFFSNNFDDNLCLFNELYKRPELMTAISRQALISARGTSDNGIYSCIG